MDDSRFDRLTRQFGAQITRRSFVAKVLGLGAGAVLAAHTLPDAEAARRGFSGPKLPNTCVGPRCENRTCSINSDCPPCQCTGTQSIECNLCNADLGICFSYRTQCSGCCVTVDDVGVCDEDCTPI